MFPSKDVFDLCTKCTYQQVIMQYFKAHETNRIHAPNRGKLQDMAYMYALFHAMRCRWVFHTTM